MLEREISIIKREYPWPDSYYMETDSSKRKADLDRAMKEDSGKENQLRLRLWEKRYCDAKGRIDGSDHFLKIWTQMPFVCKERKGFLGKRRANRFVEEIKDVFQLEAMRENVDFQHVWKREFLNFACFYIEICRKDKNFSTSLFGIGKLSDETLANKLIHDLQEKTILFPKELGLASELGLLAEAAKEAFALYFPEKVSDYGKGICNYE